MSIKGMLVYLDESLYRKFRSKLAAEGKTVKEVIHDFVTLYIEENDENQKNTRENETKK